MLHTVGNAGLARPRHVLEARSEIYRIPGDRIFPVGIAAGAARHHLAARNADMDAQVARRFLSERSDRLVNVACRPHGALRIVGMRGGRAENGHDVVADMLVDRTAIALDDTIDDFEIAVEQVMRGFGSELAGAFGEARDIGKQDRDLAAGALDGRRRNGSDRVVRKSGDGSEKLLAVTERCNAEFLQILIGEFGEGRLVDLVGGEIGGVALQSQRR